MPADFCEEVSVVLKPIGVLSPGALNRTLRELGATLDYDVYNFDRIGKYPIWQSESFAMIDLFKSGQRVDPQSATDEIRVSYPMATIPSNYIVKFVDVVFALATRLETRVLFGEKAVNVHELVTELDKIVTFLLEEWGEEPGSESLAIMIEEQVKRR